jgi:hypothetical protein
MNKSVKCTKKSAKHSRIKSIKCLVLTKNPPNCQPCWFSGKMGGGGGGVKCQNQPLPGKTTRDLHIGWLWEGGRIRVRGGCVIHRLNHHLLTPKSSPYWVLCGLSWPRSLCSLSQGVSNTHQPLAARSHAESSYGALSVMHLHK